MGVEAEKSTNPEDFRIKYSFPERALAKVLRKGIEILAKIKPKKLIGLEHMPEILAYAEHGPIVFIMLPHTQGSDPVLIELSQLTTELKKGGIEYGWITAAKLFYRLPAIKKLQYWFELSYFEFSKRFKNFPAFQKYLFDNLSKELDELFALVEENQTILETVTALSPSEFEDISNALQKQQGRITEIEEAWPLLVLLEKHFNQQVVDETTTFLADPFRALFAAPEATRTNEGTIIRGDAGTIAIATKTKALVVGLALHNPRPTKQLREQLTIEIVKPIPHHLLLEMRRKIKWHPDFIEAQGWDKKEARFTTTDAAMMYVAQRLDPTADRLKEGVDPRGIYRVENLANPDDFWEILAQSELAHHGTENST